MYIMNTYTWLMQGWKRIVTWGCTRSPEFHCGVAGLRKLCSSGAARLCLRRLAVFIGSVVGCAGKLSAAARSLSGRQKITKKVAGVVDELQDFARYVGGLASMRKTATKLCSF